MTMDNIATVLRSSVTLPAGSIPVADTAGFKPSGTIAFNTEDSTLVVVSYTSKTASAFTGASGGTIKIRQITATASTGTNFGWLVAFTLV